MEFIFSVIFKANIYISFIYIISFFIEKITGFFLLTFNFKDIKNLVHATGAASLAAIFYLIVNLIVLVLELDKYSNHIEGYSFFKWFIIVIILTYIFGRLHYKLSLRFSNYKEK